VYGLVRSGQAGSSSQKYVGSLGHESEGSTGLIYMRARYMDPVLGRFLSEDPAKHGNDWFLYCIENPINSTDSTGLFDTSLEIECATAEEAVEAGEDGSVAQAIMGRARELVDILQSKYSFLKEVIKYGYDGDGNAGIGFRNIRLKRSECESLFRFFYENGQWKVKYDGPNFGGQIPGHHFLASQIEQLEEFLNSFL